VLDPFPVPAVDRGNDPAPHTRIERSPEHGVAVTIERRVIQVCVGIYEVEHVGVMPE